MKQLCIAHRGKHDGKYFENTKEAFIEAGKGKFFGIETDIHLTKDKVWITHHNDDIVSGGNHYFIKDLTLEEIMQKKLDNNQGHENAKVCLFKDYLEICKESGKRPIIEIKNSPKWEYIKKALDYVDEYMGLENVTIIAFYPQPIFKIRTLYKKKVHMQFLIGRDHQKLIFFLSNIWKLDIDILHEILTKDIVDKVHKRGSKVNVWTVDENKDFKFVDELGVDYITTNHFTQEDNY